MGRGVAWRGVGDGDGDGDGSVEWESVNVGVGVGVGLAHPVAFGLSSLRGSEGSRV